MRRTLGKLESVVRKVLRETIIEKNLTLPYSLTYFINDVATDEQKLEMIVKDKRIYHYITAPNKDMTKLQSLKWKL